VRLPRSCRSERRHAEAACLHCGSPQGLGEELRALEVAQTELGLNSVFLSGVLIAEPQEDKDRRGEPVTLLLVAFLVEEQPGEGEEMASCEVEVPDAVAAEAGGELRAGAAVVVTGILNGGGGVWASLLRSGPTPGEPREAPLN